MFKLYNIKLKCAERSIQVIVKRYKNNPNHWSVVRKKVTIADKAFKHFDEFYSSAFGARWLGIKKAIVKPNKYVAVVNNFGDDLDTIEHLEKIGSVNLKDMYDESKEFLKHAENPSIIKQDTENIEQKLEEIAHQLSQEELGELYGNNADMSPPTVLDTGGTVIGKVVPEEESEEEEERLVAVAASSGNVADTMVCYDEGRIIDPQFGLSSLALANYVPATKLKGKEDWLPESHQFQYYLAAKDFPVTTEECDTFEIPQYLNVYSFDRGEKKKFYEPKVGSTGVLNYYLMDGASILPVMALNPQGGDRVLDMCAAPGGKALLLLLTMMPGIVIANDNKTSRINRIHTVLKEYLYDYSSNNTWEDRVIVTQSDGRRIKDEIGFDKVLVDAPCTSDRNSVKNVDDNLFRISRLRERLHLPDVQSDLLCNALSLCKVGGTVVYSTCTLSPIQNDGVVQVALKKAYKQHKIEATVKLFTSGLHPLRGMFQFGEGSLCPKYGHLVIPHFSSNFGPGYFATIVRQK